MPASTAGPVVRLQTVSKVYRTEKVAVQAISAVTLAIAPQRFSMIVGPSGSGKTTLLNLIGCIDAASTGLVEVCGQDVGKLSDNTLADFRARHIGFIFQSFNLMPVLTAAENVEYPLILLGMKASERRRRVAAMLDAVGLAAEAGRRPNELSGGQKQRVAVARALVKQPSLVLADEPTANLDSHNGAAIIALMRRMQEEARTSFVFSTHDPELMAHSDETFTIRDGALVGHEPHGRMATGEVA